MEDYIYHHGIKGQKWGVRRFQNEDDSLTVQGKQRYDGDSANNTEGSSTKKKFILTDN